MKSVVARESVRECDLDRIISNVEKRPDNAEVPHFIFSNKGAFI